MSTPRETALTTGASGRAEMVVTHAETAIALRSGDVAVLATPSVVRLAEEATVAAVAGRLAPGTTTVGQRVQLDHVEPTPIGGRVQADAVLETIKGRRLTFRITVNDDNGLIAAGRITRVVVERDRFMDKASATEGDG